MKFASSFIETGNGQRGKELTSPSQGLSPPYLAKLLPNPSFLDFSGDGRWAERWSLPLLEIFFA